MFERFTNDARHVVVLAQDEARTLRHTWIGTEHLLLGLLRREESVAAQVLGSLGVEAGEVRAAVTRIITKDRTSAEPVTGQIPFTPRAKKVLELALREALAHGSRDIDTEHILLGLARDDDGLASVILLEAGIDAEQIREETLSRLPAGRRWRGRRSRSVMPNPTPARWAYRVEPLGDAGSLTAESLNELGAEGWELVSVAPAALGGVLVFKRRLHEPPEPPSSEPAD